MKQMNPVVHEVVRDLMSSPDAMYSPEEVTFAIMSRVYPLITDGVNERNKFLAQRKETRLNQIVQSIINDMWATTTRTIKDSSLDTDSIDSSKYALMVKQLIPELIKSTNNSLVRKVLGYAVIEDELNIIIRKTNNASYSVQELTDKIFSKLVNIIIVDWYSWGS